MSKKKRTPFRLKKPLYMQNDEYTVEAGILTDANPTNGELIVPEGVTEVTRAAVGQAAKLVMPSTLLQLKQAGLIGTRLQEVDLSKATNLKVIPQAAFAQNMFLNKVVLPEGLEKIGAQAFVSTPHLKEIHIPNSITEINSTAFIRTGLKKITHSQPEVLKEKMAEWQFPQSFIDLVQQGGA